MPEDLPPEEPLELDEPAPKKPGVDLSRIKSEASAFAKVGTTSAVNAKNWLVDRISLWKLGRQQRMQKLALGEALADENWGEAELLLQLKEVDDEIHDAGKTNTLLSAERKKLLLKLAEAGERAESVPEAARRDWTKVRATSHQIAAVEARLATSKSQLIPQDKANRVRFGISAAALGSAMFLGFLVFLYLLWPSSASTSTPDTGGPQRAEKPAPKPKLSEPEVPIEGVAAESHLTASLGLVACGYEIDTASGEHLELLLGHGTGFAVTADGWLFTNKHVVEKLWELQVNPAALAAKHKEMEAKARTALTTFKPRVWVFFGPDKYPADMIHVSGKYDFAILKTERKGPYFRLRAKPEIPRSEKVFALGFPGAAQVPLSQAEDLEQKRRSKTGDKIEEAFKARDFVFVLTNGVVSRIAPESDGTSWVQHNAAINPGNSGGPLVSEDGTVVGINTLLIKDSQGVFFSLGIPQLKTVFENHVKSATWK